MAFSSFNSISSFIVQINKFVSSYIYNFPGVGIDASLALYYPLDTSSNSFTPNYASGLPVYDASLTNAIITRDTNSFVTGIGDLSLNNTMGSSASSYVTSNTSFDLVPSKGLSIACWFSCSGQLNTTGTLFTLVGTSDTIEIDICRNNIFSRVFNFKNNSISRTASGITGRVYCISCTDNGEVIVGTSNGIFYNTTKFGTNFLKSSVEFYTLSVSMNNAGIALASTSNIASTDDQACPFVYYSSDYGKTWVLNRNMGSTIFQITVSESGLSFGTFYNNGNGVVQVKSSDYFQTYATISGSSATRHSFASNGSAIFGGTYYNNTGSFTTITPSMYASLSFDGKIIVGVKDNTIYYAAITNGVIGTFSTTTIPNGVNTVVPNVGNNGYCYVGYGDTGTQYMYNFNVNLSSLYTTRYNPNRSAFIHTELTIAMCPDGTYAAVYDFVLDKIIYKTN